MQRLICPSVHPTLLSRARQDTATPQIVRKFGLDVHGRQRINPTILLSLFA